MSAVRTFSTFVLAGALAGGLALPAGAADPSLAAPSTVGIGGAGAFIPPAHVNGVFGAGGPLAGVGGAGAFIPPAHLGAS
jgi:hypothetical protein